MTRLVRVGDLDVPQDLARERRAYRVRQGLSVVIGLVLLAALLGVLGRSGALSDATARGGAMAVEYERFVRLKTPTELRVRLTRGSGPTSVALGRSFFDAVRVESFGIEPDSVTSLADRVVFTFEQQPPSELRFELEPQRAGLLHATVHGPAGDRVTFDQWVWP